MEVILDMSIEIDGFDNFVNEEDVANYVKEVLSQEYSGEMDVYMSLLLTGNKEIQEINREYRDKDMPTDVISFAYHETDDFMIAPYDTLGDIIISLERVVEQAKDFNHSPKREFYYVLTHGILHLLGYDHIEEEDKKIMRQKEEEILGKYGYTREI